MRIFRLFNNLLHFFNKLLFCCNLSVRSCYLRLTLFHNNAHRFVIILNPVGCFLRSGRFKRLCYFQLNQLVYQRLLCCFKLLNLLHFLGNFFLSGLLFLALISYFGLELRLCRLSFFLVLLCFCLLGFVVFELFFVSFIKHLSCAIFYLVAALILLVFKLHLIISQLARAQFRFNALLLFGERVVPFFCLRLVLYLFSKLFLCLLNSQIRRLFFLVGRSKLPGCLLNLCVLLFNSSLFILLFRFKFLFYNALLSILLFKCLLSGSMRLLSLLLRSGCLLQAAFRNRFFLVRKRKTLLSRSRLLSRFLQLLSSAFALLFFLVVIFLSVLKLFSCLFVCSVVHLWRLGLSCRGFVEFALGCSLLIFCSIQLLRSVVVSAFSGGFLCLSVALCDARIVHVCLGGASGSWCFRYVLDGLAGMWCSSQNGWLVCICSDGYGQQGSGCKHCHVGFFHHGMCLLIGVRE